MRKTLFAAAALFGLAASGMAFAQGATPETYLRQAQQDVRQHHPNRALMALNNAENELLRSGAAEEDRGARDVGRADPSVVRQMARAREAIQEGHWQQAEIYINDAMHHPSASRANNPGATTTGTLGAGAGQ
jgi:hypothetical protein